SISPHATSRWRSLRFWPRSILAAVAGIAASGLVGWVSAAGGAGCGLGILIGQKPAAGRGRSPA
ncbi:MAG: hypothetical protein WKF42_07525, partial [Solirubrobacteraceae bacterium]